MQVIGALLGTQNGREVEIVNSFDLAADETTQIPTVDDAFLVSRTQQCELYSEYMRCLTYTFSR